MIEASFEAVVPKAINAEFEAVIPREKAFDIVNKDIHIDTNGKYEVKADAGTAMTEVKVETLVPTNIIQEEMVDYTGKGLRLIKIMRFAEGVTTINVHATSQSSITHIYLPSTLIELEQSAFHTSQQLEWISIMPKSLEKVGAWSFSYCGKLRYISFENHDFIPILSGSIGYSGPYIVPDNLYDDWIKATNWAVYADKIFKASEFVEPTNN